MKIMLNGQKKELPQASNISEFLQREGYGDKTIAVAVNGEFVPKSKHADRMLSDGDALEIVAPMQGG